MQAGQDEEKLSAEHDVDGLSACHVLTITTTLSTMNRQQVPQYDFVSLYRTSSKCSGFTVAVNLLALCTSVLINVRGLHFSSMHTY